MTNTSDGATVTAAATGGTSGTDSLSELQYGVDPVGDLNDGINYFDVAADSGNMFGTVTIDDCNADVTSSSALDWWNGTSWVPVVGHPGPTLVAGSPPCLNVVLDSTSSPTPSELTGTVFAATAGDAIDSVDSANLMYGQPFTLTVLTSGTPTPVLTKAGRLPSGLHFVDNHDGTATISGTPTGHDLGFYQPVVRARFGSGHSKQIVTQVLTLFEFQSPIIKGQIRAALTVGSPYSETLTAEGYPVPAIDEIGTLPNGIAFETGANGSYELTGSPRVGSEGSYPIEFSASNGVGSNATRYVTLVVR